MQLLAEFALGLLHGVIHSLFLDDSNRQVLSSAGVPNIGLKGTMISIYKNTPYTLGSIFVQPSVLFLNAICIDPE